MAYTLSEGAIALMFDGATDQVDNPTLQILSVKKVSNQQSQQAERYRLIISDGVHFIQAMMATQLNHLVGEGQVEKLAIVQLPNFACQNVQNRKLVICLNVEVLGLAEEKIGSPVAIEAPGANGAGAGEVAPAEGSTNGGGGGAAAAARENKTRQNDAYKAGAAKKAGGKAPNGNVAIYPIEGLSPYQNKWTIKARVTSRSDIKHYSNARGDGKLFSVNLLDETGEIRATGFGDTVDNFYEMLEEGKVFFISHARVNIAKKQFSNLNNEYELTFDNKTVIEPCTDTSDVPQVKFNFVELGGLQDLEKDVTCDVIGIVKDVGEIGSITSKATQRSIPKREITLVDKSSFAVRMTLWGRTAETFEAPNEPVIAFKGVKIGDFGGRSLSMLSSSSMVVDPDIGEAHALRGWYDATGNSAQLQQYSNVGAGAGNSTFKADERTLINDVRDNPEMGQGEKPDYFGVRATVMLIKEQSISYPACPTDKCNKKLSMENDDSWRCEKCDRSFDKPEHRYMLQMSVGDFTGQLWLSGFNDVGQLILGMSADELNAIKEEDELAYTTRIKDATLKTYDFGCRAKAETWQEQTRVKYQVMRASPVNFVKAGIELADEIRRYGIA